MVTAAVAVIATTIAAVEWMVDPFASVEVQHSQQQNPRPKHTIEESAHQNTQNTTTTIESSTDVHTFPYSHICSDTLSMTTAAMDQSMQKCSMAVQRVVRQRKNSSAVMMAAAVALAGTAVAWRRVVEGVEYRPEQRIRKEMLLLM